MSNEDPIVSLPERSSANYNGEEEPKIEETSNQEIHAANPTTAHRHFKMYKPAKVLTQFVFNERKRKRRKLLGDYMDFPPGTMAIGRLDEDSEGLLLLTTDGKVSELVRRKSVEKEYWVQVDGQVTKDAIQLLEKGVEISLQGQQEPYKTMPCKVRVLETICVEEKAQDSPTKHEARTRDTTESVSNTTRPKKKKMFKGNCNKCGLAGHKVVDCPQNECHSNRTVPLTTILTFPPGIPPPTQATRDEVRHGPTSWISITVSEGKYRQVRKMTAAVGFPTLRLVRVRIGSISLDKMGVGEVRELDNAEISSFV